MTQEPGPTSLATVQAILAALTPLLGTWRGRGKGMFPTLDNFVYSETLCVQRDPGTPFFTYQQDTELIGSQGHPVRKSHWEAGVLRPLEDGNMELACVQGSGRVEVLRGRLLTDQAHPEILIMQFDSRLIGNDDKVKKASRKWFLTGNHLKYVMKMATTRFEELNLHLEANLNRDPETVGP